MLAFVLTLVLALYVLGPDLFSRLIVSQFAPARPRSRNKGEELIRAIVLSSLPVVLVYLIAHVLFHRFTNTAVLRNFLLGLYGEQSLEQHSDLFFSAARSVVWTNLTVLLIPVYSIVLTWSLFLGYLIKRYGRLLRAFEKHPKKARLLTWLVRPWVATWHLELTRDLLPKRGDYIRVDVLTKMDVLYRGTLAAHHLNGDGELVSITLTDPHKFKRQELLNDREATRGKGMFGVTRIFDTSLYWSRIQSRSFLIMASEIVTLNLNYVDPNSLKEKPRRISKKGAGKVLDELHKRSPHLPGT